MTSVTIPNNVTNIGDAAFAACFSLTNVTVPDSITSIGERVFSYCYRLTRVVIPNSVTNIGDSAFANCSSLPNITIPDSVTTIAPFAFAYCTNLSGVFFQGNAPEASDRSFDNANNVTVYYLPRTTDWSPIFAGRPTALWNPEVQINDVTFGVGPDGFGFTIIGTIDIPIVIEVCTNLELSVWMPLKSLNLISGSFAFSDPHWTESSSRFYRIRSPF